MPVHGEIRHLHANADLAIQTGVPRENVVVVEDGGRPDRPQGGRGRQGGSWVRVRGRQHRRRHHRDLAEGSPDSRRRGFHLGDRRDGLRYRQTDGRAEIQARGFAEDDTVFDDLKPKIEAEIEKAIGSGVDDMYQLQQVIRRWSASGSVTPTAAVR